MNQETREALAYVLNRMRGELTKARERRAQIVAELRDADATVATLEQRIAAVDQDLRA